MHMELYFEFWIRYEIKVYGVALKLSCTLEMELTYHTILPFSDFNNTDPFKIKHLKMFLGIRKTYTTRFLCWKRQNINFLKIFKKSVRLVFLHMRASLNKKRIDDLSNKTQVSKSAKCVFLLLTALYKLDNRHTSDVCLKFCMNIIYLKFMPKVYDGRKMVIKKSRYIGLMSCRGSAGFNKA